MRATSMSDRLGFRVTLAALFTVALVAGAVGLAAAQLPSGGTFTDDDGNIHEGNIEAIAAEGITRGCNPPVNDLYCPDSAVTRGQMAAFLVRAMGYSDDGGGNKFTDDDDSVFEADIDKLATAGVTLGCNPPVNDLYCPDSAVTRGQMAAFLVRAMGYSDDGGGNKFTDDDDSVFEADIDKLATAGVTLGCNPPANTEFCPDAAVTRDQMASFLARALGLEPVTPPPPTTTTTTSTTVPGTDHPQSGDSWGFSDCENDTGTCAYSASGGEGYARLTVHKPLAPTDMVLNPSTLRYEEVTMWKFKWFDPAGTQIAGGWSQLTFYSLDTGMIDGVRVSMPVTGRAPGDYRVEMCRKASRYSSVCVEGEPLLEVYFEVTP